jgi:hypothetical protein
MTYLTTKPFPSIFDVTPLKPLTIYGVNNQPNVCMAMPGVTIVDMTFGTVSLLGCVSSVRNMDTPSHSAVGHIPYATPTGAAISTQITITTIAWLAPVTLAL